MSEVRVLVLAVFLRICIFNFLLLLTCILDGMPNINAAFLMLSLILVIPLPRLEPVLFILDEIFIIISVYIKVVQKIFGWSYCLILLPLLTCLSPIVRWLIRRYSIFTILLRNTYPYWRSFIIWLVPTIVSDVLLSVCQTMVAIPLLWVRSVYWFVHGPVYWTHSLYLHLHAIYTNSTDNSSFLWRYFAVLIMTAVALIVALPSPVSVLNYIVTGYGYPGSMIRFSYCPALRKTNLLSYLFLEISYSLWNIIRTVHFYLFSKYLFHGSWSIHINIKSQIGPFYTTWLMGYSRVLCIGLLTPLFLPFQCFEQIFNNFLCTSCHLAFLTILNGHTCANFFMIYYGICSILIHIESAIVAVASTLHSLRLSVNDHVTTVICVLELYLMLHVSWLTCKIIWRKIKSPNEDVLWKLN